VALRVFQVGRAPVARVVARARTFHFDDVGAQVRQVLGAPGAGQDAAQVEHADAIQRWRSCSHMGSLLFAWRRSQGVMVAVPWLMTTTSRAAARTVNCSPADSPRHMSTCSVSPGYTGAENRAFRLVSRAAS